MLLTGAVGWHNPCQHRDPCRSNKPVPTPRCGPAPIRRHPSEEQGRPVSHMTGHVTLVAEPVDAMDRGGEDLSDVGAQTLEQDRHAPCTLEDAGRNRGMICNCEVDSG